MKSLGLDELGPFKPEERIIEYVLRDRTQYKLESLSLRAFANETASESPAPGGGSIAAYLGTLGVSLATMVANLSAHKPGWDDRWEEFSNWAEKGATLQQALIRLVDEDTLAFNKIMAAFGLPKATDEEKKARTEAIALATKEAIETPLKVVELATESLTVIKAMAELGNPNSVTDAGVGALCARSAVKGAFLNVRVNATSYNDKAFVDAVLAKGSALEAKAEELEKTILAIVDEKLKHA